MKKNNNKVVLPVACENPNNVSVTTLSLNQVGVKVSDDFEGEKPIKIILTSVDKDCGVYFKMYYVTDDGNIYPMEQEDEWDYKWNHCLEREYKYMKYSIKTTKTLNADNNLKFSVGQDIAFMIYNEKSNCHNHYIGEITEITEDAIIIKNIEINKEYVDGKMIIDLNLIAPNSCGYVSIS